MANNKQAPIRFWSSVEYASIMSPIVRELQALGYDAEHRFYISSFDYRTAQTNLERLRLRARMYLLYPLHFMYNELVSPSSHCVICTNTFYTPLLSTFLNKTPRHSIHLLYDLFPDALVTSGKLANDSLIARGLRRIVDATLQYSCANVILGNRLKQHIAERLSPHTPNEVIPVGTDCAPFPLLQPAKQVNEATTKLLYCGNLGHLHEVDTLVACLADERLKALPLTFQFCGNGAGMEQLKGSIAPHPLATFSSGLKAEQWVQTMSTSPIGLVTMRPGAESILLPSKTYSAMAAGQAILAICPKQSDLADLILEHDCGWVVEPGRVDTLIDTLEAIVTKPDELQRKRANAQAAALQHYDARPVAKRWLKLFKRLAARPCPTL